MGRSEASPGRGDVIRMNASPASSQTSTRDRPGCRTRWSLRQVVTDVESPINPRYFHSCAVSSVCRKHPLLPSPRKDVDNDLLTGSPDRDIDLRHRHGGITEDDLIQRRHRRLVEGNSRSNGIEAEPLICLRHIPLSSRSRPTVGALFQGRPLNPLRGRRSIASRGATNKCVGRLRPAITLSEHQPSRELGRVRSFSLTRTAAPRSSARPWDSRTAGSISHDIALVSGRARLGDAVRT